MLCLIHKEGYFKVRNIPNSLRSITIRTVIYNKSLFISLQTQRIKEGPPLNIFPPCIFDPPLVNTLSGTLYSQTGVPQHWTHRELPIAVIVGRKVTEIRAKRKWRRCDITGSILVDLAIVIWKHCIKQYCNSVDTTTCSEVTTVYLVAAVNAK